MTHVHEKEHGQDFSDLSDGFLFAELRELAHSVLWANLMPNMLDVDMFAVWNFSKAHTPWPYQSCPCSETHVTGNLRCVHAYHLMASRVIDIACAGSDILVRKDRFGDCGAYSYVSRMLVVNRRMIENKSTCRPLAL